MKKNAIEGRKPAIRQCPISQGEQMITAYGGQVTMKRHVGVDPAWI